MSKGCGLSRGAQDDIHTNHGWKKVDAHTIINEGDSERIRLLKSVGPAIEHTVDAACEAILRSPSIIDFADPLNRPSAYERQDFAMFEAIKTSLENTYQHHATAQWAIDHSREVENYFEGKAHPLEGKKSPAKHISQGYGTAIGAYFHFLRRVVHLREQGYDVDPVDIMKRSTQAISTLMGTALAFIDIIHDDKVLFECLKPIRTADQQIRFAVDGTRVKKVVRKIIKDHGESLGRDYTGCPALGTTAFPKFLSTMEKWSESSGLFQRIRSIPVHRPSRLDFIQRIRNYRNRVRSVL